jgi:hypothetical protein
MTIVAVCVIFSLNIATASDFDQTVLEERVKNRWISIDKFNFKTLYEYESPSFRKAFPIGLYVNKFSQLTSRRLTKIIEVKYDEGERLATVLLSVETGSRGKASTGDRKNIVNMELKEHWLFIQGKWWFISS